MTNLSDSDKIYTFHHLFDPINMEIASKVLKLNCFKEPRKRFDWDFVNDIGVINLLRNEYYRTGNIESVFRLYQSTRLDEYSHRYESLFALLVITIIGGVVSGIVIEHYKDFKESVSNWIKSRQSYSYSLQNSSKLSDAIDDMLNNNDRIQYFNKFCSKNADELLADLQILTKCFIARKMLDENQITQVEYHSLVSYFLKEQNIITVDVVLDRFNEYEIRYSESEDAIKPTKVMAAVDGYSKGILRNHLESVGVEFQVPVNTDTADYFRGFPASPGFAQGIAHVFGEENRSNNKETIFVVDSHDFSPDYIDLIRESSAVVTTNCGLTGHIPLICRGMRKGCVILNKNELAEIKNGDKILVSGRQGIVAVGLFASREYNK